MVKLKKIVSITVCCLMLMFLVVPASAAQVLVTVDSITAEAGENVSVPIHLTNNTGICGATISVAYNANLLLTGVDKGDALSTLSMTKPGDFYANPVKIVWDGMDADNSNGVIATLKFTAPSEAGTYNISISYENGDIVDGNLNPVSVSLRNGSVKVSGEQTVNNPIVSTDEVNVNNGGSVDVPIRISGNTGICGATFSVSYDERLTLTKITKGTALSSLAMTNPGNLSANPARIVWDGMEQDESNGIIATLTFTVPDNAGKYDVNISYDDGDIVDGNLSPVDLDISNGFIKVVSSNQITVKVNDKSVLLSGSESEGKIIVAFYDDNRNLISVNLYDVDNIQTTCSESTSYAKVMWWNSSSSMKPMCDAQTINFR
ncbi:MAG: hypothetical protein IJH37_00680 [Clostridia bacterium]|nr:hypothetical protein [Clostridia bacterium]